MPPPVESESDESDGGVIPHKKEDTPANNITDNEEEDDDEDEEDGVFIVEKILNHKFQGKTLFLEVKWKGYDKAEDNTWEPEENVLEGAEEVLQAYYDSKGGRPEPLRKQSKKRQSDSQNDSQNSTPETSQSRKKQKRASTAKKNELGLSTPELGTPVGFNRPDWMPDHKNWEKEVETIETLEPDYNSDRLVAYVHWKNGKKSRVDKDSCYKYCPQAMLRFYERNLVFK